MSAADHSLRFIQQLIAVPNICKDDAANDLVASRLKDALALIERNIQQNESDLAKERGGVSRRNDVERELLANVALAQTDLDRANDVLETHRQERAFFVQKYVTPLEQRARTLEQEKETAKLHIKAFTRLTMIVDRRRLPLAPGMGGTVAMVPRSIHTYTRAQLRRRCMDENWTVPFVRGMIKFQLRLGQDLCEEWILCWTTNPFGLTQEEMLAKHGNDPGSIRIPHDEDLDALLDRLGDVYMMPPEKPPSPKAPESAFLDDYSKPSPRKKQRTSIDTAANVSTPSADEIDELAVMRRLIRSPAIRRLLESALNQDGVENTEDEDNSEEDSKPAAKDSFS